MSFAWVLCLLLSQAASGREERIAVSLQVEVNYLEDLQRKKTITKPQKERLAEIYFLTSRCSDVKLLKLGIESPVSCVCGGKCAKDTAVAEVERFRQLLASGTKWTNPKVQQLWHSIQNAPEARYWALKAIRKDAAFFREPKLVAVRLELEKSLESLEVQSQ